MANKYIDKSATFNGDGTASNQAASAGAVGAWNSLANCLNNVPGFGSIANGDNIYIRTKNGTNLSETKTDANITTPARTAALPVNWIFDDGTVWPGDAGVFTLTTAVTTTGRNWTLGDYNNILGVGKNFKFNYPFTGGSTAMFSPGNNYIKAVLFETNNGGNGNGAHVFVTGINAYPTFDDCAFKLGGMYTGVYLMRFANSAGCRCVGCEFDLYGVPTITGDYGLFNIAPYGGMVEVSGGQAINTGQNQYLAGFGTQSGSIICDGFDTGMLLLEPHSTKFYNTNTDNQTIDVSSIGSKNFGMSKGAFSGVSDWAAGLNYPYGNAVLPDVSNTPWSYRVFSRANKSSPQTLPLLEEIYTDTAATKTITANLLINNNLTSPQKDEWWMTVSYVSNVTGLRVSETTRATGALDTATGVWNSTVYGAQNYTQYKTTLTTAAAIKQYTTILVTLFTTRPAVLSTDFYFVDPEVVIV